MSPRIIRMEAERVVKANSGLWVIIEREINSMEEPVAWARKYFVAASVSWFEEEEVIRGMKDSIFSSKEAHKVIKLEDEHAICKLTRVLEINK